MKPVVRKISQTILWLFSLLIAYALSVGPVLRLTRDNRRLDALAGRFYRPILNIGNTDAWPILRTYLRAWGVHEPAAEWALAPALPAVTNIVRFECARHPLSDAVWKSLPPEDGKFIIETIRDAAPWESKSTRGWLFGRLLPAPADFAIAFITPDDRHYDLTFSRHAQSFSMGRMVWDVPAESATNIAQRIERVLQSK